MKGEVGEEVRQQHTVSYLFFVVGYGWVAGKLVN